MEGYIWNILFWISTSVAGGAIGWVVHRSHEYKDIKKGIRAILRDNILRTYNACNARGSVPYYALKNMDAMYNAYHSLGGNGSITEIYHKFMDLPMEHEGGEEI